MNIYQKHAIISDLISKWAPNLSL